MTHLTNALAAYRKAATLDNARRLMNCIAKRPGVIDVQPTSDRETAAAAQRHIDAAAANCQTRYIPLLRPASFSTLPAGLEWTYVEVPHYITKRPDLPRSKHPHGMIECRKLTAAEMDTFDLRAAP